MPLSEQENQENKIALKESGKIQALISNPKLVSKIEKNESTHGSNLQRKPIIPKLITPKNKVQGFSYCYLHALWLLRLKMIKRVGVYYGKSKLSQTLISEIHFESGISW